MALASVQSVQFGLAREATHGTAEAAPTKWYPIFGQPDIKVELNRVEDKGLRAIKGEMTPIDGGRKSVVGKITLALDAQTIGEFLNSCVGGCVSAVVGATAAYTHTFTPPTTLQPITYTFFFDFGASIVKKYNMVAVKSISFSGPVDNLIMVDIEWMGAAEAAGAMGSPSFPTNHYLGFQHVTYNIASSSNLFVKSWTLKVDNQMKPKPVLAQTQYVPDWITPDPLLVTGSMVILIDSATERDKWIANTNSAISMVIAGDVCATPEKYTVTLPLTSAGYQVYDLGWEDGLLASQVTFKGYHNGTSAFIPVVKNLDTSYNPA